MSATAFVLPAGEYWIGDPSYPFLINGVESDMWETVLETTDWFETNHCDLPNIQIWAAVTPQCECSCPGTDGREYVVETGLLGILPKSSIDFLGSDKQMLSERGRFKTFGDSFKVVFHKKCVQFGDFFMIYTCERDQSEIFDGTAYLDDSYY